MLTYLPGSSPLHKLDPVLKLLLAIILCVLVFLVPYIPVIVGVLVFEVLLAITAGCGKWALKTVWKLFKITALLFIIQVLSVQSGNAVVTITKHWHITETGIQVSLILMLRLISSCLPIALMLRLTKSIALANSLNKYLFIPYKYAFALSAAFRFIPIFSEEMAEIIEAQTARGVELDTKNFVKRIKLIFPLCVPLLLSSVRKIEAAAISAELRGVSLRK